MYFTVENINALDDIVSRLNNIENAEEQRKFLEIYVEDPELLSRTIKKIRQCKFPSKQVKCYKSNLEISEGDLYSEDEIEKIFSSKNNEVIMGEYSLKELKSMYFSIYKKKPLSSCTKKQIVSSLRERFRTLKRARAFALLAEERNKRNANIF